MAASREPDGRRNRILSQKLRPPFSGPPFRHNRCPAGVRKAGSVRELAVYVSPMVANLTCNGLIFVQAC